ncbi:MAG: hypothetical protein WCY36_05255 [Candidatus Omnitrophota bacterium]
MKYLSALVVLALVFSPAALMAEEGGGKGAAIENEARTIDVEPPVPMSDEIESGVNNEREMPQSQTYDPNTGLPDNVESDRAGEIE